MIVIQMALQIRSHAQGPAGYKVAGELTATSGDCDDDVAAINPGAAEVFDGIDNNCNGVVDEGFTDADGDGYFLEVDDCDDADPNEHPGQTWYKDADNDSYSDGTTNTVSCTRPAGYKVAGELTATSGDCDDDVAAINPGAAEVFDGIDNNCNGVVDEGFTDADGDGYFLEVDDCDDADPNEHPRPDMV